jgi:hypothetical protein
VADYFNLLIGQKISFDCHFENKGWEEMIESTIDLYGNLRLVSLTKKAVLDFENKNSVFVVYDYQGGKDSALFVLYASVPRAPYESSGDLTYSDMLPAGHFLSWGKRVLSDFMAPFFSPKGRTIYYRCKRRGSDFTISGSSVNRAQQGIPGIETMAIFREGQGWIGGYVIQEGKKFEVTRKGGLLQNL